MVGFAKIIANIAIDIFKVKPADFAFQITDSAKNGCLLLFYDGTITLIA